MNVNICTAPDSGEHSGATSISSSSSHNTAICCQASHHPKVRGAAWYWLNEKLTPASLSTFLTAQVSITDFSSSSCSVNGGHVCGFGLQLPSSPYPLSPGHVINVHSFKCALLPVTHLCHPYLQAQMLTRGLTCAYIPLRILLIIASDWRLIANWVLHQ